jgi:hypothetical protein
LSEAVVCALLKRPAAYLKVRALLVPRKHKAAHNNSDIEPLEAMILYLEAGIARRGWRRCQVERGTGGSTASLPVPIRPTQTEVKEAAEHRYVSTNSCWRLMRLFAISRSISSSRFAAEP